MKDLKLILCFIAISFLTLMIWAADGVERAAKSVQHHGDAHVRRLDGLFERIAKR